MGRKLLAIATIQTPHCVDLTVYGPPFLSPTTTTLVSPLTWHDIAPCWGRGSSWCGRDRRSRCRRCACRPGTRSCSPRTTASGPRCCCSPPQRSQGQRCLQYYRRRRQQNRLLDFGWPLLTSLLTATATQLSWLTPTVPAVELVKVRQLAAAADAYPVADFSVALAAVVAQ